MTRADRVHSTPPTNTPIDTMRRRFLSVAAGASVASVGALAIAALPPGAPASPACAVDPAFALIAAHRAAEVTHCEIIDAQGKAQAEYGFRSDEAWDASDRCAAMCDEVNAICWKLATIPPTTLAGVAAVLRFANEVEDAGGDWPDTDTIGPDGWHYQLRALLLLYWLSESPWHGLFVAFAGHRPDAPPAFDQGAGLRSRAAL
jgi:hypothetical protein